MIINKVATLEEIENSWSLDDVYDVNNALDLKTEAELLSSITPDKR